MAVFNNELWSQLLEPKTGPCVTLYLPYGFAGSDRNEMRIHRKNLLSEAEDALSRSIAEPALVQPILHHIKTLKTEDQNAENGIYTKVFFLSPHFVETVDLPMRLKPILKINRQFYLTPLLQFVSTELSFYLMDVSRNGFQIFRKLGSELELLDLKVPSGLVEYYGADPSIWSLKSYLEIRDRFVRQPRPLAQARSGRFLGLTNDDSRIASADLEAYLRHIDEVVCFNLEKEYLPLVIVGTDEVCQTYKALSRYPYLKERHVSGNFSDFSEAEIMAEGQSIAQEDQARHNETLAQEYYNALDAGLATDDYRMLHQAASSGLIKTLLVCDIDSDMDFSPSRSRHYKDITDNQLTAAAEDLIDEVTLKTFMTGGKIVWRANKDMPNQGILAGVLRANRETIGRLQPT